MRIGDKDKRQYAIETVSPGDEDSMCIAQTNVRIHARVFFIIAKQLVKKLAKAACRPVIGFKIVYSLLKIST